jgi:hypothetical protein
MAVMEGILVLAFAAILNGLLQFGADWTATSLQSPQEYFGSPTAPAVLPRPARPGAETAR